MNSSWWRKKNEMEDVQKEFINLPLEGKYLLSGPPGSGKTNLLLLRAEVMVGSGEEDVLFLTYTNTLADFIKSGATSRSLLDDNQIKTFHSWAYDYIWANLQISPDFDRDKISEWLAEANKRRPSQNMYSAIFVDEAQDLTKKEIEILLEISERVCICGDTRQGIYQQDGMDAASNPCLEVYELERHFRMGTEIAKIADKLMPPMVGMDLLENTCNYNQVEQGASSAKMWSLADRDTQFAKMIELIEIQLDAFKGDTIGVFCGKKETLQELFEKFNESDYWDQFYAHGIEDGANFTNDMPIHLMTLHSSKGTEFKCVHIYGAEDLDSKGLQRTTLSYTGITRAKTALNIYRTGRTTKKLQNAFAEKKDFNLSNLFPDDE